MYAPLIAGATTVVFEGALDYPAPETTWKTLIEEYRVTGIFTSPTAVRLLMRYGDAVLGKTDHQNLERVFLCRRSAERARLGVVTEEGFQEQNSGD